MKLSRTFLVLTQRQMSKKGSSSKSLPKATSSTPSEDNGKSPISTSKNGDFVIAIQVKPGAKFNCITDISEESVGLQISAPPVDGEANAEVMRFFSTLLKLKKTEVDVRGGKSRQKIVVISSKTLTPTTILQTLKENIGEKF